MLSLSDLIYQGNLKFDGDDDEQTSEPTAGGRENDEPPRRSTNSFSQHAGFKRQREHADHHDNNAAAANPPNGQKKLVGILKKRPKEEDRNQQNSRGNREAALNAFYFGDDDDESEALQTTTMTSPSKTLTVCTLDDDDDDADVSTFPKKKRLVCPPIVLTAAAAIQRRVPRRHLRKPGRIPYKRNLSAQEIESYYETPEQAKERLRKRAAHAAHYAVRRKWKERKFNMKNEVDVGGAISTLARKSLRLERKKRKREERKKRKRKRKEEAAAAAVAAAEESDDDAPAPMQDDLVDSSDEERENALGSLLRASQPDESQTAAAAVSAISSEPANAEDVPNEESEDYYWKMGHTAPPRKILQFKYHQSIKTSVKVPLGFRDVSINEEMFKDNLVTNTITKWSQWSSQNFPLSLNAIPNKNFVHPRQLLQLASRYIVSSAGDAHHSPKAGMDQRLLRLLFKKSTRQVGRLRLLTTQARETAINLQIYRQHKWRNSSMAAASLGISATQELGWGWTDQLPLAYLAGYSMEPRMIHGTTKTERRNLIQAQAEYPLQHDWSETDKLPVTNDPGAVVPMDDDNAAMVNTNAATAAFGVCNYLHLPGTTPPVPQFPLDAAQVIFGRRDQHAHASYNSTMDHQTYNLTICSLVSHWTLALERKSEDASRWWKQIQTFIEHAPNLNVSKLYKRVLLLNKNADCDNFPLVPYYHAMMGYCSVMANLSFVSFESENSKPSATWDDSSDADEEGNKESIGCDHSLVARTIHDYCQNHVSHNSLQHFSKLRTIFGLVSVAKMIPPSAAEILSRPLDDIQLRTPFDVMRMTLEHLEEERMLLEGDASRSGFVQTANVTFVNVGELEYAMYKASKVFAESVGREPHNVEFHTWHLSALSGCLLLCSGLRIGGKPRRFPSSKSPLRHIKSHDRHVEVRCKLPTYDQVRREVAEGFLRMVRLAGEQNGYRSHLSVSSFLEWKQVVALLMGPSNQFENVRKLHTLHVLALADSDPQELSLRYVSYLWGRKELDTNKYLSMLATKIENDPSQQLFWRKLVAALGPVGVCVCDELKKDCREEHCKECGRLGRELNVDHSSVKAIKSDPDWWGKTRTSWWLGQQLNISVPKWPKQVPFDAVDKMEKQLRACKLLPLKDITANVLEHKKPSQPYTEEDMLPIVQDPSITENTTKPQPYTEEEMLWWLPCKEGDDDEDLEPLAAQQSALSRDQAEMLPASFCEVYETTRGLDVEENLHLFSPPVKVCNRHLEALCHKVIVTCHLYSNTHDNIIRAVEHLLRQCIPIDWENTSVVKQDCDAWRCLVWLTSFGLNVTKILEPRVGPPPKSNYSLEEQEAVIRGIERFGTGKWMAIKKDNMEVLAESTHIRVRDIYKWLLRRGKVSAPEGDTATESKAAQKKGKGLVAGNGKGKHTKGVAPKKRASKKTTDFAEDTDEEKQTESFDESTDDENDQVKETKRPAVKKLAPKKVKANSSSANMAKVDEANDQVKETKRQAVKKRVTKKKEPPRKKTKLNQSASENHDKMSEQALENHDATLYHDTENFEATDAWAMSNYGPGSVVSENELDNISIVEV